MNIAICLSGGIGKRVISDVPKQYVTVRGKMVVTYCLQALCANKDIDVLQVVAEKAWWEPIQSELNSVSKLKGFSLPGENRQLSILSALRDIRDFAEDDDIVFIHDAVRPFVSDEMISATIANVSGNDGAVPVLPLKDTVYLSTDGAHLTGRLNRAEIVAGQAPEAFLYKKYLDANERLGADEILSLSGSAEPALMAGLKIATFPGDEDNFKITTNNDLERFKERIYS